jgi:ADP-L-glycero-D-manno-heptose 6-epimerase
MKILLTGHRGFIGSHLLAKLLSLGHDVSTYEWGDSFPSVIEQDWVIHVGAISSTTEKDVEKIMRQNVDFTTQLYDVCKTYGVNFQFASSASVYGFGLYFAEDAPVDPRTPYAWSKYLCERHITTRMGGNVTQIFRYFNVYGPDGEEHKGNQASPFCQFKHQAIENGKIKVFENSKDYLRDFISVNHVVDYHLQFLNIKESGIFNIGTGSTLSFLDVAEKVLKNNPADIEYISMPDNLKCSYQKYTCADMSKTWGVCKTKIH